MCESADDFYEARYLFTQHSLDHGALPCWVTNNKAEKDAESLVPHMIWHYKHNIGVGRTEFTLEELDNAIKDAIAKQIQEVAESSVQR